MVRFAVTSLLGAASLLFEAAYSQVVLTDGSIILTGSGSLLLSQQPTPTGPYTTYTGRITLSGQEEPSEASGSDVLSGSASETRVPISQDDHFTVITGRETSTTLAGNSSMPASSTSTSTSTSAQPINTQPCNNYVEFCDRKWSNITYIGCHNSPFVRPGNVASNQMYPVTAQLNDGVRFLQAQIQYPANGTEPHFCHTSCDLLDAGPITEWLTNVTRWVEAHPFDVVTILLGNGNYSSPDHYASYIESTGITKYTYEPPVFPMERDEWPTLAELIIRGKRVIMFMDYNADQRKYPWLLDEFSQMWETPFDPTDRDFPCTVQRPPDLSDKDANKRLYLFNHNLNVEYNLFGGEILAPAVSLLNVTNNVTGEGSLGVSTQGCVDRWGRAPNVLNVDYYNFGGYPGSVFEVAAMYNNVTYDRECCGTDTSSEGSIRSGGSIAFVMAFAAALLLLT